MPRIEVEPGQLSGASTQQSAAAGYRAGGGVAGYARSNAASLRWVKTATFAKRGGTVLSFVGAGASQVAEDWDRNDLTTTDRVGRTAGAAAWVGGGAVAGGVAGAELGGALGTFICPGIGTGIGGAIGRIVGGIGGSAAGGWAAEQTKGVAVHVGQDVANVAVDGAEGIAHGAESAWHATDGARHAVSDGLSALNPFG